jgi:hypothetical protein
MTMRSARCFSKISRFAGGLSMKGAEVAIGELPIMIAKNVRRHFSPLSWFWNTWVFSLYSPLN